MFTLRFITTQFRPNHRITLRTSVQDWQEDIPGNYSGDSWVFALPDAPYQNGFECKFILEQQYWMLGENLPIQPFPGGDFPFDEQRVQFPPLTEILPENGIVPRRFFQANLDPNLVYDVIVIGSGIGGGILADQLADRGLEVLVLEAGSYLFPTHVGNLPRQHFLMKGVDKNIWGMWDDFKITNYTNAFNSAYIGGQGFNLGGRSIFWGGLIPEMKSYEFEDDWPDAIQQYMTSEGYVQGNDLMQKAQVASDYQDQMTTFFQNQFPSYRAFTAPMAISHTDRSRRNIGGGVFSTADLLMESQMSQGESGNLNLTINLNHAAKFIETSEGRATAVVAADLIGGVDRKYLGREIVLSAGTVESTKLALLSGLQDPNGKIGQGITDHPIFFTHFALPKSSPFYRDRSAAKLLMQHNQAGKNPTGQFQHRYNVVIELGTDFNQGRFVDPDLVEAHLVEKGAFMLCEIVFLFHAPLVESNQISQAGDSFVKPNVFMQEAPIRVEEWEEVNAFKNAVIQQLGGVAIEGQNLDLQTAGLGGVAHEVGTLRMGEDGVVNADLKFHGYENLYACDLSVFPNSPAANPTLTLGALALRLATHLKDKAPVEVETRGFESFSQKDQYSKAVRNMFEK
ncbi:MAG: GMC oxidoreductase [Bacteroidota bacterium]